MKFIKDILLFDLETTGTNPDKDAIIQLSAILLDKDNLLEKKFFNHYIRVSLLEGVIGQHADMLHIPFEAMHKSPKIYDAIKIFRSTFSTESLLSTHNLSKVFF